MPAVQFPKVFVQSRSAAFEERFDYSDVAIIDTTSNARGWSQGLSPFLLGPVYMYAGLTSYTMENAWQYSKVYADRSDDGEPTPEHWVWATQGWANRRAVRYPAGKGARPLYSIWKGKHMPYIEARHQIYAPLYAAAVLETEAWRILKGLYETKRRIVLRDFDGYDHHAANMSLTEVLNNQTRPMGHAFVLAALLTHDPVLACWGMPNRWRPLLDPPESP